MPLFLTLDIAYLFFFISDTVPSLARHWVLAIFSLLHFLFDCLPVVNYSPRPGRLACNFLFLFSFPLELQLTAHPATHHTTLNAHGIVHSKGSAVDRFSPKYVQTEWY
jgi:hypothetical protein